MTKEEAVSQLKLTSWAQRNQGNHYLADALDCAIKALEQMIPEDVTNGQVFIHVFGIDAWKQMIEFSSLNDQFKEFWNAPYKESEAE